MARAEALKSISLKEGRQFLPDGTIIILEYEKEATNDNDFGDVDEHEAEHAVVAIKNGTTVIEASVIPNGNVGGYVQMASPDMLAASTSKGRSGNSHDRAIVEGAGESFEAKGSVAHGMIRKYKKEVRAVASALKRGGKLSGKSIENIIARVQGGERIKIHVYTPDGKYQLIQKQKKDGEKNMLRLSELPLELPKPANKNHPFRRSELPKAA